MSVLNLLGGNPTLALLASVVAFSGKKSNAEPPNEKTSLSTNDNDNVNDNNTDMESLKPKPKPKNTISSQIDNNQNKNNTDMTYKENNDKKTLNKKDRNALKVDKPYITQKHGNKSKPQEDPHNHMTYIHNNILNINDDNDDDSYDDDD